METLASDALREGIHAALRAWHDLAGNPTNLLENLLQIQMEREKTSNLRLATNQVLIHGIELLKQQDHLGAEILSLRFMDQDTVLMVGRKLDLSEDQVKRRQRAAIANLAQIILEQEELIRQKRQQQLQSQLMPADYSELFGVEEISQQILDYLHPSGSPWVLALVGIGGIGKTALSDKVARRIIQDFIYDQVVWLQVDFAPGRLPHEVLEMLLIQLGEKIGLNDRPNDTLEQRKRNLHQFLKSSPSLIVIDNLESEADVSYISPWLIDLANPGKFLLTSRVRLPVSTSIMSIFMSELSRENTVALIQQQARLRGQSDLVNAPVDKLQMIHEVTGGNPLAIKLVVGLADVYPLPDILTDLKKARTREVNELYKRIYLYAWNSLSPHGQALLEVMPMASHVGVKPEELQVISKLEEDKLWPAISELVNRSLLEVRGTAWERRYTIHRLTESFLFTEIIHWPESLYKN